ncbi:xanthine dehydrogenase family protein molybdopterin-binding subunit [Luteolibacter sp. GHJ8]|uniref:Xanthine dehydrogenase family protein molybdopterin-binding subunit n=1 Tax=Luteolibacter rhizosphaerae TaxID=2989719 RepID=A0ABT3G9I3_9BACT|nr:xanthine dehydrogenase family protein molybdopterin-binding subunit [Luteolibacter rhizosphaerae]MCW1916504.1 xanthine dehydrogenase family protein molybdopterin-binding subunit [Luteolibacter rhizosphaerae]
MSGAAMGNVNRVDGPAKVTGKAKYASDFRGDGLLYGRIVDAPIARGRILSIETEAALACPGVVYIFTHDDQPSLAWLERNYRDQVGPDGSPFRPLHDDVIRFSGQVVALVLADSLEAARHGAGLVRLRCEQEAHATDLEEQRPESFEEPDSRSGMGKPPEPRGDVGIALVEAPASIQERYSTSPQHHNPMEPFATTAIWERDGSLTVYDKTQAVMNDKKYLTQVFGFGKDELQVLSPFVGGAFGSGLRPHHVAFLAVLAARELKRNVRVVLERKQMFALGFRPPSIHDLQLGATAAGHLTAVAHDALGATSRFENYVEQIVNWSGGTYDCPNVRLGYRIAALDVNTPCDMRAPGAASGVFALESAVDELAWKLGMDPLEFRILNHAAKDPNEEKPYSSKQLLECYRQGAERFEWHRRGHDCGSMRDGSILIGWGVATGVWDAMQVPSSAKAVLGANGKLTVSAATSDIGTGTYTMMAVIAARTLGLSVDDVVPQLGDSRLPMAPLEGGSFTAASVGTAVQKACLKIRKRLIRLAKDLDGSLLAGVDEKEIILENGRIAIKGDASRSHGITEVLQRTGTKEISRKTLAIPSLLKQRKVSIKTHSAVFAEVKVDEDLGTLHVTRVVCAVAAGQILNLKTARSQIMGGVVWGISMALHEESVMDHAHGRFINHDLAGYHIPVNADVGSIEVIFVEEKDSVVNPLGVKGVGEIGIVGTAAAVANAVFHATGKRVRSLPITLDKLL